MSLNQSYVLWCLQMKKRILDKSEIFSVVKNTFPHAIVMFIYYCGSIAFGLEAEDSDIDVTVVLDRFDGNVHLTIGSLDIFAYGKDTALKKQVLDSSVPSYDRAYIDEVLSPFDTLIYLNEDYRLDYEQYRSIDMKKLLKPFLASFVEHYQHRLSLPQALKSNYHIFRIRGILENLNQSGKYEHQVFEPYYTMMIDYKKNWNNPIGKSYHELLKDTLRYIEEYIDVGEQHELG
jgi:predicted nucleotidyltransferase